MSGWGEGIIAFYFVFSFFFFFFFFFLFCFVLILFVCFNFDCFTLYGNEKQISFCGDYQTATRFLILHFGNPFFCYYLTNGSRLMLIPLNSAFKHISLIHSNLYK